MKNEVLKKIEDWLDFFVPFLIALELALLGSLISTQSLWLFIPLLLCPYLTPLLSYKVLIFFFPIKRGGQFLDDKNPNSWNCAFKLQNIFYTYPFLERTLIVLGLYSFWLRLWGSKIGKNVLWTSRTLITDRMGVSVGDNCFFGHECTLVSHVITIRRGKIFLYYRPITIGNNVFVAARAEMGPGSSIASGSVLKVFTRIHINQEYKSEEEVGEVDVFFSRN